MKDEEKICCRFLCYPEHYEIQDGHHRILKI